MISIGKRIRETNKFYLYIYVVDLYVSSYSPLLSLVVTFIAIIVTVIFIFVAY